jgi:hypothetical protein
MNGHLAGKAIADRGMAFGFKTAMSRKSVKTVSMASTRALRCQDRQGLARASRNTSV